MLTRLRVASARQDRQTLVTRVGSIQFRFPQVRGGLDFYPSALEKGVCSEQALMLALAEMYV